MSSNNNVLLAVIVALAVGIFGVYKWKSAKNADPQDNWQQWNPQDQEWQQWTPLAMPPGTPPTDPPTTPPGNPLGTPRNYTEAINFAKRNNKQVLLVFGAEWCQWCKKLKTETLASADVQSKVSGYVYYYVDTDKEKELARKYKVSGVPYYAIVNPSNESVVRQGNGFKSNVEFIAWLEGRDNQPRNQPRPLRRDRSQPPSQPPRTQPPLGPG